MESTASLGLLADLLRVQDYQQQRANVFPGIQSLRWFIRQNQSRLIAAGALLTIAGRHQIDPAKFDQVVLEVGRLQREAA